MNRRAFAGSVAVLGMLAACTAPPTTGGGEASLDCPVGALEDADGPVKVVFWHSEVAAPQTVLEAMVARYNASQHRVEVVPQQQGTWDESYLKYIGAIQTNQLPGLVEVEDTKVQTMIDGGTLLPAQSCMEAVGFDLDDIHPAVRSYYTLDDVFWPGYLAATEPMMLFNAAHFERAGLDPNDPPGTLDELYDAAVALKQAGVSDQPFAFNMSRWYVECWLNGAGAPVVNQENGRDGRADTSTFDNPTTLELYEFLATMKNEGLLLPAPVDGVDDLVAVATQESSIAITSSGAATSIVDFLATNNDPNIVPRVGPFPGIDAPGRVRVSSGAFYIVNQSSPEVQAGAWDFLSWMLQEEQGVEWLTTGSYIPFQLSLQDDAQVAAFYRDDLAGQMIGIAAAQLDEIDPAAPGPLIGPYVPFTDAIHKSLEALLLSGAPADRVIATADGEIQDALDQYNGT